MVDKKLINGLKYEKLLEEQLYDLSQWELVDIILAYRKDYKAKEQECEELRGVIRKDICSHYVLGECSKEHHNNCVGRNQCIKDLEQENEKLKIWRSITPLKTKMVVKALTEIKEIVEKDFNHTCWQTYEKQLKQILQKCEVLNE